MSNELSTLRRIGVYLEPNGQYQTLNGTYSDFVPVPFKSGSEKVSFDTELFDPGTASTRVDYQEEKILGNDRCSLSFAIPLQSHGLDCNGNTAVPPSTAQWPVRTILQAIFGNATATTALGTTTAVQATTSTTQVKVQAGHEARFTQGGVIACEISASEAGRIELREVLSTSSGTVNVVEAFSATPVTGTAVRGGISFYTGEGSSTSVASLQAIVEGADAYDRLQLRGMQASAVKLDLPLSGIPSIAVDLTGAGWSRMSNATVGMPTFTYTSSASLIASNFTELTYTTVGSTTRAAINQSKQAIELPLLSYAPITSGSATNGIAGMYRKASRPPVKGSFTTLFDTGLTWENGRDNLTDYAFYLQIGNRAGASVLIALRCCQVVDVKQASSDGINGQDVMIEGRMPSTSTTAIIAAPVAIHFV